jgi:dUTP pyrophosphatase
MGLFDRLKYYLGGRGVKSSDYDYDYEGLEYIKVPAVPVRVRLLSDKAFTPLRGTSGSIGLDLAVPRDCVIEPESTLAIDLELAIIAPCGYYGRIATRSSLALLGITCDGVIDPDYLGSVKIIARNNTKTKFTVDEGMRIGQIIFERALSPTNVDIITMDGNKRMMTNPASYGHTGRGGLGSTGLY